MRKFLTLITAICFATSGSWSLAQEGEPVAIKIPGSGTYTAPISTDLAEAQAFFDQGLRMAWSFYFPEAKVFSCAYISNPRLWCCSENVITS